MIFDFISALEHYLKKVLVKCGFSIFNDHEYQNKNRIGDYLKYLFCFYTMKTRIYWPVHKTSVLYNSSMIKIGIDSYPGVSPFNYIQGVGGIEIGDYTQIGPSVTIVSGNHDLYDTRNFILKNVKIGSYCWIGSHSVILPGVVIGDFTVVAAGSIVTKSIEEGYCVIAGNPAVKIKSLDKELCLRYSYNNIFYGFRQKR